MPRASRRYVESATRRFVSSSFGNTSINPLASSRTVGRRLSITHCAFRIVAVQRGAAGRLQDETAPLVVAKRLHIHMRSLCHLSDRQRHALVLLNGNEGYTPYLSTGSRHPLKHHAALAIGPGQGN